jgi:pyruvate dehydrogenase E1 component alpha subunit
MRKTIAEFKVDYVQVMDETGNVDKKLMPALSQKQIIQMYEQMVIIRAFDVKAVALQRQGRMGTYAAFLGQEATQVGSALALEKDDWLIPTYRESGAMIARGYPMHMVYQYWAGDERGHALKGPPYVLPISIPVSSQCLHAAGIGMALSIQKKKSIALGFLGDGATSKGDFHEAANFAGVYKSPTIFLCCNNQWAISVPRKKQTAAETLAQKAIGYGFEGIQVDGNDVFAVYSAVMDAAKKARAGKGPTLIEAFTYRLSDHTTSDNAGRYRTEAEVAEWKKKDPILRLENYMVREGMWTDKDEAALQEKAKKLVEEAVAKMEAVPAPKPSDMFTSMYGELTPELREQMEKLS